jgi:glycosyltransferase involved in cell wall biosynthesis
MNVQNGAAFIREALDSLFQQDFEDWELIAWDDCSTDESAEIIRSYKDPRVRSFYSSEAIVLGRARDYAIREARGEWVAFLDQDDVWLPHKLRKQVALGAADPSIGLVYGRTLSFNSTGIRKEFDHRHEFSPLPEGNIFEWLFIDGCFIPISAAMFRRSALKALGAFPEEVRTIPDYYILLAVSQNWQARAVEEVICLYRWHSNNMTFRFYKRLHHEALWMIDLWSKDLDPRLVAHRRRVHHTNVAFEELRSLKTLFGGIERLVRHGSVVYFLSRPFARGFRALRRRIQRPYYLKTCNNASE